MRKVIVTGCLGQLGACLTRTLINTDWEVIGLDVAEPETVVSKEAFEYHKVDVTDQCAVTEFYEGLASRSLSVDGLVNNVGTAVFTPFEERSAAEIDAVTSTNINAPIYMSQGFLKIALPDYKACIVNIASIYGLTAPDQSLYSDTPRNSSEIYGMTKAATISLTQYLAVYLAKNKIRCNCISPGGVLYRQGPEFVSKYSTKVPMNRMANEEEIIAGVTYLLDASKSSYVNGANLVIDGGFTSWR